MKLPPIFLSGAIGAAVLSTAGAANLVHHYTFDDLVTGGNATDSVGGATGTWNGDAGANIAVAGFIGAGASQTNDQNGGNGQEHYTTATLTGLNGATGLSISVWFSQSLGGNTNSTYNALFMTRTLLSSFGGGSENWGVALEDNAAPRHIDWRVDGVSGTETDDILEAGDWHHVGFVWDGVLGTRTLYFDGVLLSSEGAQTGSITNGGSWDIGNDTCCGNREFTGTLDDVSVWDGALSAAEVGGLYTRGLAGLNAAQIPEPGVIGLIGVGALLALRRRR